MAGSIHKLKDRPRRPWRAVYRDAAGRQRSRTFERKVDAERWLRGELGALDRGEWVDPGAGKVTVSVWCETWLAGLDVKPKTMQGYVSLARSRILPRFGSTPVARVAPADVRAWLADMSGEGLAPATVAAARRVLSMMLRQAVEDGALARNPVDRVKAPTVRPRRQRFLTAEQVEALAGSAELRQEGAGGLVRFLAYSGLRWGEAVALRWSSTDVDRRRIRVREAASEVAGDLVFGSPKTHEERTVIVPTFVLAGLPTGGGTDLVFRAPQGGPLRQSNFRRRVWRPAVTATEIPPDLVVHDLRDTAAALAISAGASIVAVARHARARFAERHA